jgi:energy-coupling factor transport system ATP-binding protein
MEPAIVDIRGLTYTYEGESVPALTDINLKINRGEFVVMTGPSGCGKSTLSLCLAGFIPHSIPGEMAGEVLVAGLNVREHPPGRLAGVVGLVQQDPEAQMCTIRVKDEVAFGPENLCLDPAEIRSRVERALAAVGAVHLADREVYTLSGGEKQRVAIASVLAMEPGLIILDEPTANLDPRCTLEVLQVMENLRRLHTSILVIEHRLEKILPLCHRLVVLEQGAITADGPPNKITQYYGGAPLPAKATVQAFPGGREPLLSVSDLSAGYPGRKALESVSFKIYPGETVAVMGDNGSGKTSLLLSLLGILKAKQGQILYAGKNLSQQGVPERARNMGLTFQNPNHQLFERTVYREAGLPSLFLAGAPSTPAFLEGLLSRFGLLAHRNRLPFTLSLGEKKRLALVSVLAYVPRLLFLDEPLAGQDRARLDLLLSALSAQAKAGGATLMICHEPEVVAACCDRIMFFDRGRLIIDAPTEEAFTLLVRQGRTEYLPPEPAGNREGRHDQP